MSADGPLHRKYDVWRVDNAEDNPESKHFGGCRLFVLDLDHDPAAIPAIRAYADAVRDTHPTLAADLDAYQQGSGS